MVVRTQAIRSSGRGEAVAIENRIETYLRSVGSARDVEISAAVAHCGSPDAITNAMLRLLQNERITYRGQDGPMEDIRYAIVGLGT